MKPSLKKFLGLEINHAKSIYSLYGAQDQSLEFFSKSAVVAAEKEWAQLEPLDMPKCIAMNSPAKGAIPYDRERRSLLAIACTKYMETCT